MTDDQKKKPAAGFWTAVVLALLVVAYPLSCGPGMRFFIVQNQIPIPLWAKLAVLDFYTPIFWLARNCEMASSVKKWYLSLWGIGG